MIHQFLYFLNFYKTQIFYFLFSIKKLYGTVTIKKYKKINLNLKIFLKYKNKQVININMVVEV
jgi:hypothetical protein